MKKQTGNSTKAPDWFKQLADAHKPTNPDRDFRKIGKPQKKGK